MTLDREALLSACQAMQAHGEDFRSPLECDMDDAEVGRYEALCAAVRAYLAAAPSRAKVLDDAARVVEQWSLPTIQTPSMWLIDKAGIAAAIRSLSSAESNEQRSFPRTETARKQPLSTDTNSERNAGKSGNGE